MLGNSHGRGSGSQADKPQVTRSQAARPQAARAQSSRPPQTPKLPLRLTLQRKGDLLAADPSQCDVRIMRDHYNLDVIDRATAMRLHQERIIHFEPYRHTAYILVANREYLYAREHGTCFYCHLPIKWEEVTLDHVFPYSQGGQDTIANFVVSCAHCNNLKASRPLEDFLKNPYGLFPGPLVPTHYYIMPAALEGFRQIMDSPHTHREMYYYLISNCSALRYKKRTGLIYYLTPRLIFVCDQLYIRSVMPSTFSNRLLHGFGTSPGVPAEDSLLFTPSLEAADSYRKLFTPYQHLSLNGAARRLNNKLLYDSYRSCTMFGKTWVYNDEFLMVLRGRSIMEFYPNPSEQPIVRRIRLFSKTNPPLAVTLLADLEIEPEVAREFDTPTEAGEKRIREMLMLGRIHKWEDGRVVFRSNRYLFTLEKDKITGFGLRETENQPHTPIRPPRHRSKR